MSSPRRRAVLLATCTAVLVTTGAGVAAPALADPPPAVVTNAFGGLSAGDGGQLSEVSSRPTGVTSTSDGSLYLWDRARVRKVDGSTGVVSTLVGGGATPAAEGVPALSAHLPTGITQLAVSSSGEVSWIDSYANLWTVPAGGSLHRRAIVSNRTISIYPYPGGLAYAPDGTLWVDDGRAHVVTFAPGSDTEVERAGGGASTDLQAPGDITIAPDGTAYVVAGSRIRHLLADGTITTVAGGGSGTTAQPADGTPALAAALAPWRLGLDPSGNVTFVNGNNSGSLALWRVGSDAAVHRLADITSCGFGGGIVARASDVVLVCNGLRSLDTTMLPASVPGTLLTSSAKRSADGTPVSRAWAGSIGGIAELSDGTLAMTSEGDLVEAPTGGVVTSLHEDGYAIDDVVALADGTLLVTEQPVSPTTGGWRIRVLSTNGATRTTVAGGGTDDPSTAEIPATTALLPAIVDVAAASDGTVYLRTGVPGTGAIYALKSDGVLHHVAGFSDLNPSTIGPMAVDPRDGSLDVVSATHVYRRDPGTGSFAEIAGVPANPSYVGGNEISGLRVQADGGLLLLRCCSAPVERIDPDGQTAYVAGGGRSGDQYARSGPDGLAPRATALSIDHAVVAKDGSLLVSDDSISSPYSDLGEVRRVPLATPNYPALVSGTTVTAGPGTLTAFAPTLPDGEYWCVQIRTDGATPHDVYDGALPACSGLTDTVTGGTQQVFRTLGGHPLVVGRTYNVLFSVFSSEGTSTPATPSAVVAPDTTAPRAPTGFAIRRTGTSFTATFTAPSDPDTTKVVIRYAAGSTPPASVTDGLDGGTTTVNPRQFVAPTTVYPIEAGQPYAVSAFAVDLQGNASAPATALLATPRVVATGQRPELLSFGPATDSDSTPTLRFSAPLPPQIVRYAVGTTAPATPTDGLPLTASYTRLLLPTAPDGTVYSVSLFLDVINGEDATVTRTTATLKVGTPQTFPEPISALTSIGTTGAATVSWTAPAPGHDGTSTIARLNRGTTGSITTGTALTPSGTSVAVKNLGAHTDWTVSVANAGSLNTSSVRSLVIHGTAIAVTMPKPLVAGMKGTITATFTQSKVATAGRKLTLYAHRYGASGTLTAVGSVTTGAGGIARFTVAPTSNTQYAVRYAGGTNATASDSGTKLLSVAPKVSLTTNSASGRRSRTVTLTVSTSPSLAGTVVQVQHYLSGAWRTVANVRLNSRSSAAYAFKAPVGKVQWRVVTPSSTSYAAGTSNTVLITGT
ncbi:MAG: repeat protein [Frankiales bacterium]|nr:repeat protein [Frankiales bacterium]